MLKISIRSSRNLVLEKDTDNGLKEDQMKLPESQRKKKGS